MRCVAAAKRNRCARAAAVAAEETPVAVAQEAREAAALVGVAAEGPDDRGLLPTPAEGPPDAASAAAMAPAPAASPRSEPVVVDLRGSSERRRRAAAAAAPAPAVSRRRCRARGFVERGFQRAPRRRRGAAGGSRGRPHRCQRRGPDAVAEARERRRRAVGVAAAGRVVAAGGVAAPPAACAAATATVPTVEPSSVDDALPDFDPARGLDAVLSVDGRPAYAIVARALDAVSATRSRLAKEVALTNSLRWALAAPTTSAQDLAALCYLLAPTRDSQGGGHRLEPDWQHVALGLPSKAIADGCAAGAGRSPDALKAAARRTGGLADAVVALRAGPPSFFKAKAPEAAVARSRAAADVRASLRALGRARSDRAKVDGIAALVRMTRGHEAKWLVKTLHPSMQGVGISLEATVLPCLGRAALVRCKGPRREDRPPAGRQGDP